MKNIFFSIHIVVLFFLALSTSMVPFVFAVDPQKTRNNPASISSSYPKHYRYIFFCSAQCLDELEAGIQEEHTIHAKVRKRILEYRETTTTSPSTKPFQLPMRLVVSPTLGFLEHLETFVQNADRAQQTLLMLENDGDIDRIRKIIEVLQKHARIPHFNKDHLIAKDALGAHLEAMANKSYASITLTGKRPPSAIGFIYQSPKSLQPKIVVAQRPILLFLTEGEAEMEAITALIKKPVDQKMDILFQDMKNSTLFAYRVSEVDGIPSLRQNLEPGSPDYQVSMVRLALRNFGGLKLGNPYHVTCDGTLNNQVN